MNTSPIPIITIDGPSGVGKGTIALLLANELKWHLLDSGALYRLTALAAIWHEVSLDDATGLAQIARELDVEFLTDGSCEANVFLEKQEVSKDIRTEQAGNAASRVAAVPEVREALLQRQRDFAQPPGLIADGRDMGTTIFPDAPVKIFLTASAEIRAERRYNQLKEKGLGANLAGLAKEIAERDARDRNRSSSPLKAADDAVEIDTTHLSIDKVFQRVLELCRSHLNLAS